MNDLKLLGIKRKGTVERASNNNSYMSLSTGTFHNFDTMNQMPLVTIESQRTKFVKKQIVHKKSIVTNAPKRCMRAARN